MSGTLTESEVAERLNVTVEDLAFWREVGLGPGYIELGSWAVRYSKVAVETWRHGFLVSDAEYHCETCCCHENCVDVSWPGEAG